MKISDIYEIFKQYPSIVTDSREVKSNSIFVALKGEIHDGNKFIESALEEGAVYAITDDKSFVESDKIILVDDTLETLQKLASYHRNQLGLPVLAITGSNGKTTTKEFVARVLSKKFNVAVTEGNFNNHIGVPLTLLKMKPDNDFAVVEMGTNHFGEIEILCKIANPNFGLINNIGKAHLEFFGSIDGVAKAKGELFEYLSNNNGKVFANGDIDIILRLTEKHINKENIITYGQQKYDVKILPDNIENPFLQFVFNDIKVSTRILGMYNIDNILATVAIGKYFNILDSDIADAIESYEPSNNRSQKIETKRNILYMDAYNANPTSMQASLQNFIRQDAPNKMFILGDMRELGASSEVEHNDIIEIIIKSEIKDAIFVGDCFAKAAKNTIFTCFKNIDECIEYLDKNEISNRTILIKGSHGIHLEKVEKYL